MVCLTLSSVISLAQREQRCRWLQPRPQLWIRPRSISKLLTPRRVTEGRSFYSGPRKTSCAVDPRGERTRDRRNERFWLREYQLTLLMPEDRFSQPGNYEAPIASIKAFRCDEVRRRAAFSSVVQWECKFGFVVAVLRLYASVMQNLALDILPEHARSNIFLCHWRGQRAAATWSR